MVNDERVDPLDKAVAALDWAKSLKSIASTGKAVTDIAKHFERSKNLVYRYPKPSLSEKRHLFVDSLLAALQDGGHVEEANALRTRLDEAALIEKCFQALLATLPTTAPGKLPPGCHAWALLERLSLGYKQIQKDLIRTIRARREVFDPLSMLADDEAGETSYAPDAMLSRLSSVAASSIVMLAIQNGWIADDRYVSLPKRPEVSEKDIYAVGITEYLGNAWDAVDYLEKRWRFFGAKVGQNTITLGQADGTSRAMECVSVLPEYGPLDLADHVGTERLNRYIIQNLEDLAFEANVDNRLAGSKRPVAEAPNQYVSKEEAFAAVALSSLLHFNVLEDPTAYGGLRFAEWIRGYAWLQCRATGTAEGVHELSRAAALQELADVGFNAASGSQLLDMLSLSTTGGDLFDTPLVRVESDRFAYHPEIAKTLNIPRIVLSRLSSLSVQINPKGKAFEDAVVRLLNDCGLQAKPIKFSRDGDEYQYDAVFLWDGHLFILEDKSYSLPLNDPSRLYWFTEKMAAAIDQVSRLADAAERYPEEIRAGLGVDAETRWNDVIRCVLFSLPWSIGKIGDTYIMDYSSVGRFLQTPTLFLKMPMEVGNARVLWRHHVKKFWAGERPTASEFLEAMDVPWQLKSLAKTFSLEHGRYQLSQSMVLGAAFLRRAQAERAQMLGAAGASDPSEELNAIHAQLAQLRRRMNKVKGGRVNKGRYPKAGGRRKRRRR